MQTKLQELTEKIYSEGVEKANEEAKKIEAEAKKQADEMIEKAKKEAEKIIKDAEKDADDLKKNSLNELQLASRQVISDVKQKIVALIEYKAVNPEIKGAFKDVEFTQQIIETIVKNWNPKGNDAVSLSVLLPEDKKKEFEAFFQKKSKELLDKGLEIKFSEAVKGGFKIGPKEGGYMVSFSEDDFENFFKAYLRPRLIEILYASK
ncbi:MAG: V-type ATP synthase subunit E [Bacteroidetes bacterium]|nr:V-type ATP synthase subunit E [Bacteroidota bacterium]